MHLNLHVSIISLPPGPPPAPKIPSVSIINGSFTVEWKEPDSSEMVDNFTFRITPNDLVCIRDSITTATCKFDMAHWGKIYNYSVSALNCGNQSGNEATGRIQLQGMYIWHWQLYITCWIKNSIWLLWPTERKPGISPHFMKIEIRLGNQWINVYLCSSKKRGKQLVNLPNAYQAVHSYAFPYCTDLPVSSSL